MTYIGSRTSQLEPEEPGVREVSREALGVIDEDILAENLAVDPPGPPSKDLVSNVQGDRVAVSGSLESKSNVDIVGVSVVPDFSASVGRSFSLSLVRVELAEVHFLGDQVDELLVVLDASGRDNHSVGGEVVRLEFLDGLCHQI